jgi:succinyl-CoA synthetase beta subunit
MKIHEYQAKELFGKYGIPVPKGIVARTVAEALSAAGALDGPPVVVKAQTHAGGRGKAGGIRVARTVEEVEAAASDLLNRSLVTAQTGPEGQPVDCLLVEEAVRVARELYVGITIDRAKKRPALIVSGSGGVEIEKLAAESPGKVIVEYIDPAFGLRPFQASAAFFGLDVAPGLVGRLASLAVTLYRLFTACDCSIVEINPLAITEAGGIKALDAKVAIDDNALFRQPELAALSSSGPENSLEEQGRKAGLNYIKLKGNVGCMVNGAGLAMATMDLIKLAGAEPANFLDVGGGATSGMVKEGLRILLSDPDVKLLFVNIFGGILRCDTLAEGIAAGAKELAIDLPVIVRLEGTNKEQGQKILASSGIGFIPAASLKEAVERIRAEMGRGRPA